MLYNNDGRRLRVALAHDHLNQKGGAEQVLRVFADMFPDAPIYTVVYDERVLGDWFPRERVKTSFLQHWPGSTKFTKPFLPLIGSAVESMDFKGYDLILSSASGLIKGILTQPGTTHVCYCHTPTRYLWSDTQPYFERLRYPWWIKRLGLLYISFLRTWDYQTSGRVDAYIANSENVRQRIGKFYQRDATVIYPPVELDQKPATWPELGNYYVIVSRLEPYKRIDAVIHAFNRLRIPLVVVGQGSDAKRLRAIARPNIKFTGYVSPEERFNLLSRALGFIHPHQDEDFGIALIEAMAAGRPVLAHRSGGPLESMIPGVTGEFFNEVTWEDIAAAVLRFQPESYDRDAIRMRAERFSRSVFVTRMHAFLQSVVDSRNDVRSN